MEEELKKLKTTTSKLKFKQIIRKIIRLSNQNNDNLEQFVDFLINDRIVEPQTRPCEKKSEYMSIQL
jgi:hypothetical protein